MFVTLQFGVATFKAQDESAALLLLRWFFASFRIVARVACIYLIATTPYWIFTGLMDGRIHTNDIPIEMFLLSYSAVGIQTDKSDFSWHPQITFSEKINLVLFIVILLSLLSTMIFSNTHLKIIAFAITFSYLFLLWLTVKEVKDRYIKNARQE